MPTEISQKIVDDLTLINQLFSSFNENVPEILSTSWTILLDYIKIPYDKDAENSCIFTILY